LRALLHKSGADSSEGTLTSLSNFDDLDASKDLVRKVVEESIEKIKEEPSVSKRSIRWELGSSWMQHLQKQENSTDGSSNNKDGSNVEPAVKGLGKQFKLLKKREKKPSDINCAEEQNNDEPNNDEPSSLNELEKLLSPEAFLRLKESGSGLHMKVCGILCRL
jgi:protein TIF31